jgi:beta-glucosidase
VALKTGERKTVEFIVKPEHLEFYNREMKRVVEPGWFKVMVGGNSVDVLQARFEMR